MTEEQEFVMTEEEMQKAMERNTTIAKTASAGVDAFIASFPDATIFDLMEFIKLTNICGAKVISRSSFKNGAHPNVRTVIEDLNVATISALNLLTPSNPELADDYVWPNPEEEETQEDVDIKASDEPPVA